MTAAQSITDVAVELPSLTELLQVLTFRAGYNSAVVLAGSTLLGLAAGIIGTFSLLRGRALVSDALAHSALPGLAGAFLISVYWLGGTRSLPVLLAGAAASGVLGILVIQWVSSQTRLHEDTAIGAVLSVFFGAGIVLLSLIQSLGTGQEGGLHHFIYGQTAALRLSDAYLTMSVAALMTVLAMICMKEFRLVCFDGEFARTQGWPVFGIDMLMLSSIVLVTIVGLQTVGMLLIVALLIIPAAAARFWTERLSRMTALAAGFGAASGYLGAACSSLLPRLPAGAVIVLISGLLFFVSFLVAPGRGLLANWRRRAVLTLRIARDHALRDMYEWLERHDRLDGPHAPVPLDELPSVCRSAPGTMSIVLMLLRGADLIAGRPGAGAASFTKNGVEEARKLIRNHRLWEEYVLTQGYAETSHVDYSADLVEHVLSREIVQELEAALAERGRLPVPPSVHPL